MEKPQTIIARIRLLTPGDAEIFKGANLNSVKTMVTRVKNGRRNIGFHTRRVKGGVQVWRLI